MASIDEKVREILEEPVSIVATYEKGEAEVHIDGNASVVLLVLDEIYERIKKTLGKNYDEIRLQSKIFKVLSMDLED